MTCSIMGFFQPLLIFQPLGEVGVESAFISSAQEMAEGQKGPVPCPELHSQWEMEPNISNFKSTTLCAKGFPGQEELTNSA